MEQFFGRNFFGEIFLGGFFWEEYFGSKALKEDGDVHEDLIMKENAKLQVLIMHNFQY